MDVYIKMNHKMKNLSRILITLLAVLGIGTGCSSVKNAAAGGSIEVVTPQEFKSRLQADKAACLLDVRRPEEFSAGHLAGAHPLNWLDSTTFDNGAKRLDKSKTLYVYCRSGHRSNLAAHHLAAHGFKVVDMKGGYLAWTASGLEVEK
jgi:rhodanese-related sulfurtransferase